MPSFAEKLKELGVSIGTSQIPQPPRTWVPADLLDALDGHWENTQFGDCFVVKKTIPLTSGHGSSLLYTPENSTKIESLLSLSGIKSVPLDQILFIDTETTGLSGGAGTYVFLIGAAKYKSDGIHFIQFFLQEPSKEPAQLAALENFSSSIKLIISYNGKSFDLPRIKNRYSFHRWPSPFDNVDHLDLLHIVRRLWNQHLPSCTLGEIEHYLLGVERLSLDIPGWQVSKKFFEYLQTGDPSNLKNIFYHNEIDVISLIRLVNYISERLSDPLADVYQEFEDQISIGVFLAQFDNPEPAASVLHQAVQLPNLPDDLRCRGLSSLANLHKKNGNYGRAIPLWIQCATLNDVTAQIELAKYFEHKKQDYQEAIHWTLSAMESCSNPSQDLLGSDLEHRLTRLKYKAANHSAV